MDKNLTVLKELQQVFLFPASSSEAVATKSVISTLNPIFISEALHSAKPQSLGFCSVPTREGEKRRHGEKVVKLFFLSLSHPSTLRENKLDRWYRTISA